MAQSKPPCPPIRSWTAQSLPVRRIALTAAPALSTGRWLDVSAAMRSLCRDVVARCPELGHVRLDRVLVTVLVARSPSPRGLQARLTPLRFARGASERREKGTVFRVQRYEVAGVEMLYLLTFCVPRFFRMPFEEKLLTVFHELYHIAPGFDGDLRRLPGRCAMHGRSRRAYDAHMARMTRAYLAEGPPEDVLAFLRGDYAQLVRAYEGIQGVVVPRPMIYPVEERR